MWPWEHLALGYLLYSGYSRARRRQPPPESAAVVLAVATQLPDLVDKPLAWTVGVLPTGTTLAHSALTAVPLVVLALLAARRLGRPADGEAFAVGYGSHLLGDVGYRLFVEDEPVTFLLWPLLPQSPDEPVGLASRLGEYLGEFVAFLGTGEGFWYLLLEAALLAAAVLLWLRDGWPGVRWLAAALSGSRRPR